MTDNDNNKANHSASSKFFRLPTIVGSEKNADSNSPGNQLERHKSETFGKHLPPKTNYLEGLFNTKPTYIAKKIQPEDLQEEDKTQNLLSQYLDNILEEKSEESSRVMRTGNGNDDEGNEEDISPRATSPKGHEKVNIFQSEFLKSSKFKEHAKGPIYRDGQIIRHSIVGSAELFEKHQRMARKQQNKDKEKENTYSADSSCNDITRRTNTILNSDSQSQTTAQGTLNTANMRTLPKLGISEKKKESKKEIKIHKSELMSEIEKMREREKNFYEEQEKEYQKLRYEDQILLAREKKSLDKFNEFLGDWADVIQKVNSKIGRSISESIILRAEDFRIKKEVTDAFDIAKTDEEKYGDIYWYNILRKGKDPKTWGQVTINDIREGFGPSVIDKPKSSLEVIRKSLIASKSAVLNLRTSNEFKKLDKTSTEYLNQKTEANLGRLKQICSPNPEQAKFLMLQGVNKLNSEVEAVLKNSDKKEFFNVSLPKPETNKPIKVYYNYDKKLENRAKSIFHLPEKPDTSLDSERDEPVNADPLGASIKQEQDNFILG